MVYRIAWLDLQNISSSPSSQPSAPQQPAEAGSPGLTPPHTFSNVQLGGGAWLEQTPQSLFLHPLQTGWKVLELRLQLGGGG